MHIGKISLNRAMNKLSTNYDLKYAKFVQISLLCITVFIRVGNAVDF